MGVRIVASVTFFKKTSICFKVNALCNVSNGRILGTFQPSTPVNKYLCVYFNILERVQIVTFHMERNRLNTHTSLFNLLDYI